MPVCLVAATDADAGKRVARAVHHGFEQTHVVDLADLLVALAQERPDVVVVAADLVAPGARGSAWVSAVESLRDAAPDVAVLVAGPPDVGRDAEHRLAAT